MTAPSTVVVAQPTQARRRARGKLGDRLLYAYATLVIAWLCMPIAVMILFSFNDHKGRYNQTFQGLTLKWYSAAFAIPDLTAALLHSLEIAVLSTVLSVTLGTMIGVALGRYRFRGRLLANLLLFAVISSPEIIMGASLLTLFVSAGAGFGFVTVLIAHVMFSLSFVAVVVRSRVLALDPSLEEAAFDLGANGLTTFRLVTFPMIFPAVLAGGLLAFALSIDDFVITNFTSGSFQTFPLWIWGATRSGIPSQVNVLGTLIFVLGVLLAVGNALVVRRRAR
jgi:spermidine/putrescine transport system permease protein